MLVQHMSGLEFFEKNAMGWSDSPGRESVRNHRRANRNRADPGVLRKSNGRGKSLGTDQENTDTDPNGAG
jgi:hypothetical protein